MKQLSSAGNPPTPVELALVAAFDSSRVSDTVGQWALIAQRIGLPAVLTVMDEFGGESMRIPTRNGFIQSLYRPLRDESIRAARAAGVPTPEICAELGLCRQTVYTALANTAGDTCAPRVVKGAR